MSDLDDIELHLALENSRKSFAQEERNRQVDLINFEPPDNPEQRQKIDQIKRLLDGQRAPAVIHRHPSPPGFHANLANVPGPSNFVPWIQSSTSVSNIYSDFNVPPQIAAPIVPRRQTTVPTPFPPLPSRNLLQNQTSIPPPLYPRLKKQSSADSFVPARPPRQGVQPLSRPRLTTEPSSSNSIHYPDLSVETPSYSEQPSASINSCDLYVPFTMLANHLRNGDLIDLGDQSIHETDCPEVTLDQIRREFDPLFCWNTEKETPIMPSITSTYGLDRRKEIVSDSPAITVIPTHVPKEDDKENHSITPLDLGCIQLLKHVPPVIEQMTLLKARGMRYTSTSALFFQSTIADYMTTRVDSLKLVIETDCTFPDKKNLVMTCPTDTLVNVLVTDILARVLTEDQWNEFSASDYGLKVYGLDEFLPESSELGRSVYVGQCLLNGRDVKLQIGRRIYSAFDRPSSPQPEYEQMKSSVKFSSYLDKEDVETIIDSLVLSMAEYESLFSTGNSLETSKATRKIREQLKSLCKQLNCIEPVNLRQHMQKYFSPINADQLQQSKNDLIASIHNFIMIYGQCTMSTYKVNPIRPPPSEIREIFNVNEKMKVLVNSMHNLPASWQRDYCEFYVEVQIYYGTQMLDGHNQCIRKKVVDGAFFPYVPIDTYVQFHQQLCLCPRETKIMIVLYGVPVIQPGQEQEEKKGLGYVSIPLFDHNMIMRQGQLFAKLTEVKEKELQPWGAYPLISDLPNPVLIVTLPNYPYQVKFPEVVVEYQCMKQDFSSLKTKDQCYLMDIIETSDFQQLANSEEEIRHNDEGSNAREMLWEKRCYLTHLPEALPLVLASVPDWGYGFLSNVYQILEEWTDLSLVQAMQLLLPQFPDCRVRQKAVEWIKKSSSDSLFNAIPQLVEALRFEIFEYSGLASFLLTLSYTEKRFAFEIYWQLQQRIDHWVSFAYAQRCTLLQKELIDRHEEDCLRGEIARQHNLLGKLDQLQNDLKSIDNDNDRRRCMQLSLGVLDSELLGRAVRLPILPSFRCHGVAVRDCGIFNSNAKPLRIVFRGMNSNYSIIHKSGDDMRQDALVLQLVGLMNDIWLYNGLDLRIVLFRCMPVGFKKGMAELVENCATLCEIQKECGVTGVFKDDVITNWLQKHNSSEFYYQVAIDNFARSCAGWCVVTYVLGIGDRHNDNILVTHNGHVFHIDFGKYMGDWQTAGGFKRDRVPFVFTAEMYHVINGGNEQRESYQTFIDYCCKAFNLIRRKSSFLTTILKMMACSDIAGINVASQAFVENNLMLELSETDAVIQFTNMINASLKSAFPRINFFIHTLAQVMTGGGARSDDNMLSFVPQLYDRFTDGKITSVCAIDCEKRHMPNKVYLYKLMVTRENETISTVVYRTFPEFEEFYIKLRRKFPDVMFFSLRAGGARMRSNIKAVAVRRMIAIERFLRHLFSLATEVAHCSLVYTFFHLILRDSNHDLNNEIEDSSNRQDCQISLKISYNTNNKQLNIFIGHVKYLALLSSGQAPDPYVKTYLRPDQQRITKRKTDVVRASQSPTFNKELVYDLAFDNYDNEGLSRRMLEVSVWNSGGLMDNHRMYVVLIPLQKLEEKKVDMRGVKTLDDWFTCQKDL